jgi:hypothetical protein
MISDEPDLGLLRCLPSISCFEDERTLGPDPVAGIYLLYDDGVICYVGQSSNIGLRLRQHRREKTKAFQYARVYHISSLSDRVRLEGILILSLLPRYNRGLNLGLDGKKAWEVKWRRGAKK